ncbi:MAG: helix-turn-helix domain-containing protein [Acidimicrobiia bacterium]|nr:helix-turn-helix domain-containing protein [Acidimicrobiia bacterium]
MPATQAVELIRDPAKAVAILQPPRLEILQRLGEEDSASGIARQMELPRQQVNYHLRELEKQGFIEFVEERRKGNCVERVVRATARTYLISPEALGRLGHTAEQRRDRVSAAYLVSAAARAIRDLAVLGVRSARAGKRLATLTLETEVRFATPESRNAFAEELATTLAQLAAKYHDEKAPGSRAFRFLIGGYPVITKKEEDSGATARLT